MVSPGTIIRFMELYFTFLLVLGLQNLIRMIVSL